MHMQFKSRRSLFEVLPLDTNLKHSSFVIPFLKVASQCPYI